MAPAMTRRAMFPGSFDPPTLGHLDLVGRGSRLFDELVIAVGRQPDKIPLLPVETRLDLLRELTAALGNVTVTSFQGLVVDHARSLSAAVLLRGIRTVADLELEIQMASANRILAGDLETICLLADPRRAFVSSRLVREIVFSGGDPAPFVPEVVAEALRRRPRGGP